MLRLCRLSRHLVMVAFLNRYLVDLRISNSVPEPLNGIIQTGRRRRRLRSCQRNVLQIHVPRSLQRLRRQHCCMLIEQPCLANILPSQDIVHGSPRRVVVYLKERSSFVQPKDVRYLNLFGSDQLFNGADRRTEIYVNVELNLVVLSESDQVLCDGRVYSQCNQLLTEAKQCQFFLLKLSIRQVPCVASKGVPDPLKHNIEVPLLLRLEGLLNLDEAGMLDAGVFLDFDPEFVVLVVFELPPEVDEAYGLVGTGAVVEGVAMGHGEAIGVVHQNKYIGQCDCESRMGNKSNDACPLTIVDIWSGVDKQEPHKCDGIRDFEGKKGCLQHVADHQKSCCCPITDRICVYISLPAIPRQNHFNMGNHSPEHYQVTLPLDVSWQEVLLDPRIADSLNFVLLRNIETGEEAQEYLLNLPTDTLIEELYNYNNRCTQKLQLVTVKHVQVLEGGGICSGIKNRLRVVTERIVSNLANHPKLTYQQAMRVLLKSLIGFKAIYQLQGYIPIHSKLIFFNQYGDVKVWMNEDLPMNEPQTSYLPHSKQNQETQMIDQVFATIEFHMANPREFSAMKKRLFTSGPITFERVIGILSREVPLDRVRLPSSQSPKNGMSPQTEQTIRAMQSQGFRVINARQVKRYVQEPGQVIYRQVNNPSLSQLTFAPSSPQEIFPKPLVQPTQSQSRVSVQNVLPMRPLERVQSPPKSPARLQTGVTSPTRVSISPLKVSHSPSKLHPNQISRVSVIGSSPRNKSIRMELKQNSRQASPVQNRQMVYYARNVNSSPSPRNSVKSIRGKVVSASPYYKQQPVPLPHVVHEPVIRTPSKPHKNVQVSRVSRVSIGSDNGVNSQNKIGVPRIVYSEVRPQILIDPKQIELRQSQDPSLQLSGYAKASINNESINVPALRKQPSINKNLPQADKTEVKHESRQNTGQQSLLKPQQSTKILNKKGSKGKQVEWIKISRKDELGIQLSKKQSSESGKNSNHSKRQTQVPNSPVTPNDIIGSYQQNGGTFTNNKFSMTDLIDSQPIHQYGLQVNLPQSRENSNRSSRLDLSKDSGTQKKMVIYTDLATIHCDDAVIEGADSKYRISGQLGEGREYDRDR